MNNDVFKNSIYNELVKLGYRPILFYNKEPYKEKDMFFCPQAPELYMIVVRQGITKIQKSGKDHYTANTTTQVKGPNDVPILHQEINSIIYQSNESSLKEKSTGCFGVLLIFMSIISIVLFLINNN